MWNQAITLGIKKEYRNKIAYGMIVHRIYNTINKFYPSYWCGTIEDYVSTGYHVHIYFEGPEIVWTDFNTLWGIGYVKNRKVYDIEGWLRYVRKSGMYWEEGQRRMTTQLTPIERFTGTRLPHEEDDDVPDVFEIDDDEDEHPPFN